MNSNNKHDCMDAGGRAPKVGALGETGAVADDRMDTKAAGTIAVRLGMKMVRYRLDVGCKHQVTSAELTKVLIEESGVDKKNIINICIQHDFTLVELPDEMPQDIFLHLKSVEIKQRKLDIKRVKARNKKRCNNHNRRGRPRV